MRRYEELRLAGSAFFMALATLCSCGGSTAEPDAVTAVTLENLCDVLPKRYCAQDRPCCEKSGYGYDRARCEKTYRDSCLEDVAAVKRKKAVFHAEKLDECLAGFQPYEDKCALTPSDAVKSLSVAACYEVVEGKAAVGEPCASLSECAPRLWPESVYCDTTCKLIHFAGEEESCGADVPCGPALLCNASQTCVPDGGTHYAVQDLICVGNGTEIPTDGGAP